MKMARRWKWQRIAPVLLGLAVVACSDNSSSTSVPPFNPRVTEEAGSGGQIQAAVDDFLAALGGTNNGGEPTAFTSGFRSINWDAIPDGASAPTFLAGDFFNFTDAPRARGALFAEPGESTAPTEDLFMVSANATNPTNTASEFGNFSADYPNLFATFSAERLFAFTDDTDTTFDIIFFVPGTDTPAGVTGFGAVFVDVDEADTTTLEYFDATGASLGEFVVPVSGGDEALSFLGVIFETPVARVRVTAGSQPVALGDPDDTIGDVVVMDDFLYGEPQPLGGGS